MDKKKGFISLKQGYMDKKKGLAILVLGCQSEATTIACFISYNQNKGLRKRVFSH